MTALQLLLPLLLVSMVSSSAATTSADLAEGLQRAHALRQASEYAAARTAYERLAQEFPQHAEPLFFIGLTARAAGDSEEALEAYQRALSVQPTLAEAHLNAASLLSSADDGGRAEEALMHYKRALSLRKWPAATAANAEYNSAIAYQALGRDTSALAAARRAQKLQPDLAAAAELVEELEGGGGVELDEANGGGGGATRARSSGREEDGGGEETAARTCDERTREASCGLGDRSTDDLREAVRAAQRALRLALASSTSAVLEGAEGSPAAEAAGRRDADGPLPQLLAELIVDASTLLRRIV